MRIDWHVHINDPKYAGPPWWRHPVPMSLENALEAHRLAGLDRTVISNAVHYIRFCETRKEVTTALESSNRYLAKCRDQHPDKFVVIKTWRQPSLSASLPGSPVRRVDRASPHTKAPASSWATDAFSIARR